MIKILSQVLNYVDFAYNLFACLWMTDFVNIADIH